MRTTTKILLTTAFAAVFALGLGTRTAIAGPEPAVGLYWYSAVDPTAGGGVSAPMFQLLVRTDNGSIYYKSGTANTAWALIGTSSGGITGSGTANTVPKWSGTTSLANSDITDDGTTVDVGGVHFQIAVATGNTIVGGTLNATAAATTLGNTSGTNIFPAALSASVNDWAPTGLATADTIFVSSSTVGVQITGLSGGTPGRRMNLCFNGVGTSVSITNEDIASTAANRFTISNPQSISGLQWSINGGCLSMIYNGTANRWQVTQQDFFPSIEMGGPLNMAGNNINNLASLSVGSLAMLSGGIDLTGVIGLSGAAPTLTNCGTTGATIRGTDQAATVVMTTGFVPAGCVVNFSGSHANAPTCIVQDRNGSDNIGSYSITTTGITYNTSNLTGPVATWDYICFFPL